MRACVRVCYKDGKRGETSDHPVLHASSSQKPGRTLLGPSVLVPLLFLTAVSADASAAGTWIWKMEWLVGLDMQ